jgi:hypothetical protein
MSSSGGLIRPPRASRKARSIRPARKPGPPATRSASSVARTAAFVAVTLARLISGTRACRSAGSDACQRRATPGRSVQRAGRRRSDPGGRRSWAGPPGPASRRPAADRRPTGQRRAGRPPRHRGRRQQPRLRTRRPGPPAGIGGTGPADADQAIRRDEDLVEPEPARCRAAHPKRVEAGQALDAGGPEVDHEVADPGLVAGPVRGRPGRRLGGRREPDGRSGSRRHRLHHRRDQGSPEGRQPGGPGLLAGQPEAVFSLDRDGRGQAAAGRAAASVFGCGRVEQRALGHHQALDPGT